MRIKIFGDDGLLEEKQLLAIIEIDKNDVLKKVTFFDKGKPTSINKISIIQENEGIYTIISEDPEYKYDIVLSEEEKFQMINFIKRNIDKTIEVKI